MGKLTGYVVTGLLSVLNIAYAVADSTEISGHKLGSVGNPVKAAGQQGQIDYIESLDCENGAIPEYKRVRSVGVGPYGNMMDKYVLRCDSGESVEMHEIYIDLHHDETETEPPEGFTIWL